MCCWCLDRRWQAPIRRSFFWATATIVITIIVGSIIITIIILLIKIIIIIISTWSWIERDSPIREKGGGLLNHVPPHQHHPHRRHYHHHHLHQLPRSHPHQHHHFNIMIMGWMWQPPIRGVFLANLQSFPFHPSWHRLQFWSSSFLSSLQSWLKSSKFWLCISTPLDLYFRLQRFKAHYQEESEKKTPQMWGWQKIQLYKKTVCLKSLKTKMSGKPLIFKLLKGFSPNLHPEMLILDF